MFRVKKHNSERKKNETPMVARSYQHELSPRLGGNCGGPTWRIIPFTKCMVTNHGPWLVRPLSRVSL